MNLKRYYKDIDVLTHIAVLLLVLLVYHSVYGLETFIPTNINWLLSVRHDWGQHYLGWAFYCEDPWTFPLGEMQAARYPVGSNVGFWDNVPGMSIILKPFAPLLPQNFQYLGFWLLLCMVLSAHYTIKIFRLYKVKPVLMVAGAVFVACNPVIIYRGMHPALSSHFLIIASIYHYLLPATASTVAYINRKQISIFALSAAINPYLCFMVSGFNVIIPLKNWLYDKVLSLKKMLLYIVASVASVFAVYFLIGMVVIGDNESKLAVSNAYQLYGMNLNSAINSGGYSYNFPALPWVDSHQYEGYMYLGIGLMLLIAFSVALFFVSKKYHGFARHNKYLLPLLLFLIASTLFAISNRVTYNDTVLFEYPIPGIVQKLGDTFRACGRVIWVPFYAGIIFVLLVLAKSRMSTTVKAGILALVIAVQAYDLRIMYFRDAYPYGDYDNPLDENNWNAAVSGFDRMITYPPFDCHLLKPMDYQDLMCIALKNDMPISTGYTARDTPEKNKRVNDSLTQSLLNGVISSKELYITTPKYIDIFKPLIYSGTLGIDYLDGYYILYDKVKKPKLSTNAVALHKRDSLITSIQKQTVKEFELGPNVYRCAIKHNLETISSGKDFIYASGWGFREGVDNNTGDSIFLGVVTNRKLYLSVSQQSKRPDLTSAYSKTYLEDSGFRSVLHTKGMKMTDSLVVAVKTASGQVCYKPVSALGQYLRLPAPETVVSVPGNNGQIGYVDSAVNQNGKIKVNGWTALEKADNAGNNVAVVFIGAQKKYKINTVITQRHDVTTSRNDGFDYDNSGFEVTVLAEDLPPGVYTLAVMISNPKSGKSSMLVSDKKITVSR